VHFVTEKGGSRVTVQPGCASTRQAGLTEKRADFRQNTFELRRTECIWEQQDQVRRSQLRAPCCIQNLLSEPSGILLSRLENEGCRLKWAFRPGQHSKGRFVSIDSAVDQDPLEARPEEGSAGPALSETPTDLQDALSSGLSRQNEPAHDMSRPLELVIDSIRQLLCGDVGSE
jgi:hypothetical protein